MIAIQKKRKRGIARVWITCKGLLLERRDVVFYMGQTVVTIPSHHDNISFLKECLCRSNF